jgi:DNA-binding response OmpR family regulator
MQPLIVVIEDDDDFRDYLKSVLTANGFITQSYSKGSEALKFIENQQPDLVILDLKLPDMTGEAICMEIRKQSSDLPIVMLTSKSSINEKVEGLSLGADDYITKPFITEEFIARIKARLRDKNNSKAVLKIADLELDKSKIEVRRGGKVINLTPQEFKLLDFLMSNPGIVLSREMILNRVWSYSLEVESRVVDVYMGYLRKKIDQGHTKKLINSVRGFGYTIKD